MKVSIDIDEDLLRRARRLTGLRTKRELVRRALQTLVRLKEQERIRLYRAKLPSGRRRPGSAKGKVQVLSPYAFKSFDEWPIKEILEWLPHLFTDAQIRKLRRADPKLSPRQVLKY
jgi:hypothetical protein